jgi:hypothetical protein
MSYERMLDKTNQPSEEDILTTLAEAKDNWLDLRAYIEAHYPFTPELKFFAKKYGWTVRYARKGKTLCYLFPEKGAFSALVILGCKETERALAQFDELSQSTRQVFEDTPQLHDGRWLWVRVTSTTEVEDIKKLLSFKRKPKLIIE